MNKIGFFIKSKCTNSFLRNLSLKKKKKFTVKILPHINSAIPSFPSSEK